MQTTKEKLKPLYKTHSLKRNLLKPANYSLLLGTKLILEEAHKEAVQYVQDAAKYGYVVKFLSCRAAVKRVFDTMNPFCFHKYSFDEGYKIKHECHKIVEQMIHEFYTDLILYSSQTGIPARDLSTASIHIKQLEYLSYYLTYKLKGRPRKSSPLAIMRNKLAYKREPVSQRVERKRKTGTTVSSNKVGTISNQYQQELPL